MATEGPVTPLQRKTSVGLLFSNENISYVEVCEVIFDVLSVKYDVVTGLQFFKNNKVILKFKGEKPFRAFLDKYEGQVTSLPASAGTGTVKIINFSSSVTFVSVRNAPFEMPDPLITNALKRYGRVLSVRKDVHTSGRAQGIQTGIRTFKMEVRHKVPTTITVSGYTLAVTYSWQHGACFKCGSDLHFTHDCDVRHIGKTSVFYDTDTSYGPVRGMAEVKTKNLTSAVMKSGGR